MSLLNQLGSTRTPMVYALFLTYRRSTPGSPFRCCHGSFTLPQVLSIEYSFPLLQMPYSCQSSTHSCSCRCFFSYTFPSTLLPPPMYGIFLRLLPLYTRIEAFYGGAGGRAYGSSTKGERKRRQRGNGGRPSTGGALFHCSDTRAYFWSRGSMRG